MLRRDFLKLVAGGIAYLSLPPLPKPVPVPEIPVLGWYPPVDVQGWYMEKFAREYAEEMDRQIFDLLTKDHNPMQYVRFVDV